MQKIENLLSDAMKLSAKLRAELAYNLLESLDGEDEVLEETPEEIETAWKQEAQKRWKEIKEGKVKCIPEKQVISEIKKRLS